MTPSSHIPPDAIGFRLQDLLSWTSLALPSKLKPAKRCVSANETGNVTDVL